MQSIIPPTPDNNISFDILSFLWQKKIQIALTTIIIFCLGAYYITKLPKIYTAQSTLLLGFNENKFSFPQAPGTVSIVADNKMDTHIEFIRSRQFAEVIVKQNALHFEEGFRSQAILASEEDEIDYAVGVLKSHMFLTKVGSTDMLRVSYDSTSPEVAAMVVNLIGPAFFEFQIRKRKEKALNASKWLNEQLDVIEKKVADAEQQLQQFYTKNQIVDINNEMEILRVQISALKQEQIYSDRIILELNASMAQVEQAGNDEKQLLQVPWVLRNAQMIEASRLIVNEEQFFTDISKRYKYKHQRYIAAKAKVDELKQKKRNTLQKVLASLDRDFQTARVRDKQLKEQILKTEQQNRALGLHETELLKLRRQVEATQKLYEVFLSRLQETEILQDIGNQDEFSVVDFATIPKYPSKPKVILMLFVLGLLASIISVGSWLVLHLVSDRQTRYTQLIRNIDVPILAVIPRKKQAKKNKNPKAKSKPSRSEQLYSESIRNLRSELMLRTGDAPIRTIVVTSVQHGKQRSRLAIDLAESFGHMGKAILIDADLRHPYIGKSFGMEALAPGLTNFISRRTSFSDSNYREDGSSLSVMPCGSVPNDPLVYLTKPRLTGFIEKLGVLYERVIIETPQVNSYSDALILSKLADGVILQCDLEVTDSDDLLEAVQRLLDSGAPLLGVVFEKAKNVKSKIPARSLARKIIEKTINY